jgi:hypothetical protein
MDALSQERDRPYDDDGGNSWVPFASSAYIGGGAGESTYNGDCLPAVGCERHETGYRAQVGGRIRDVVGVELGYIDFGTIQRNGGETRGNGAIADITLNAHEFRAAARCNRQGAGLQLELRRRNQSELRAQLGGRCKAGTSPHGFRRRR